MRLKKLMGSLGVLLCLLSNSHVVAYAETTVPLSGYDISLAYEIGCDPISDLEIRDSTAYCTSSIDGVGDDVSITATQTLQKHWGLWIWCDVEGATWTKNTNRGTICLSSTKQNLDKGTYHLKSVFVLTNKNGKSEPITIYSGEQKVP